MDCFRQLLEAAGLQDPAELALALEIPVETARLYVGQLEPAPPRMVVLAVERLVDRQLAEQIIAHMRRLTDDQGQ